MSTALYDKRLTTSEWNRCLYHGTPNLISVLMSLQEMLTTYYKLTNNTLENLAAVRHFLISRCTRGSLRLFRLTWMHSDCAFRKLQAHSTRNTGCSPCHVLRLSSTSAHSDDASTHLMLLLITSSLVLSFLISPLSLSATAELRGTENLKGGANDPNFSVSGSRPTICAPENSDFHVFSHLFPF